MFDHFVSSVVICPLLVVLAVRFLADRLRPEAAVRFLVLSLTAAAVACLVTITAFGLKAIAELPATGAYFHFSDRIVRADTAHEPWVSWLSVALTVSAVAGIARVWWSHRRDSAAVRPYTSLGASLDASLDASPGVSLDVSPGASRGVSLDGRVLLVDDDRAAAFAIPGADGRIIVTTGMRAALDDTQYAALLAHEDAHLRGRHHRLVLLARLAAAVHPAFRLLTRRIDYLVERAADEQAAARVHDRRAVARAIGAAALISAGPGGLVSAGRSGGPLSAGRSAGLPMAPAAADLRRAGTVPRRVASLLSPLRAWSPLLLLVPAGVAVFDLVWTAECVWDLGELLYAAQI
ncbi:M48 family metalloprotease [Actinoplanes derwentensis]|uniref:Peptidase family M48 n=1 Tax=Actinoplanes derwentensis TaxID=113562 RepID=A0A1H1TA11_9ACTN|nr:M48 family metalloprotease [Actinoplanes derwentensis]GID89030.1 membrane protein [Actinoplanes derwentensis]SDS57090.1 Peptidase family M48 [Actinoplanes derwentensis]